MCVSVPKPPTPPEPPIPQAPPEAPKLILGERKKAAARRKVNRGTPTGASAGALSSGGLGLISTSPGGQ